MQWLVLPLCLLVFIQCQQKPTVGVSDSGVLIEKDYRKVLLEGSVVFDTRSPFDFNIGKIPGSINLPLSDFKVDIDKFDAARRLSLYGVNPQSKVVIVGDGKGDEQKLAWEFCKLGVTQVETLNVKVFRLMNLRPEAAKENVTLWKPSSPHKRISLKEFNHFKVSQEKGTKTKRFMIVDSDAKLPQLKSSPFGEHFIFDAHQLFDEKGLLDRSKLQNQKFAPNIKKYDAVFLFESGPEAAAKAYALVQFGAQSLVLVY